MGYIPQSETSTLVVSLGYAFQATFTGGSSTVNSVGFAFTAADVGELISIFSGDPVAGGFTITWTTVATFVSASQITVVATIPHNSASGQVNVVLYRPLTGATNYLLSGSTEVDTSLTSFSTAQFTVVSLDHSLIPPIGMPVLIKDTEIGVEYFGGTVDSNQVTNEPGSAIAYSACQCVGWEVICQRRTTLVSDAIADNDSTYGAANPSHGQFISLRPDQIADYYVRHALFDDGVTEQFDTSGPILPVFSSIGAKVSDAMDQLVNASNSATAQFEWFMTPRRVLVFTKIQVTAAPFNISDADLSDANALIQVQNTKSRQNYFNRGLAEITAISQTFIGNGVATSFTLGQVIPTVDIGQVSISLNSVSQQVGVLGVDTGKEWYYTPGSNLITQTTFNSRGTWSSGTTYAINDSVTFAGHTYASITSSNKGNQPDISPSDWRLGTILQSTDVLIVSFPVFVEFAYDDLAAQAAQQAVESGSGIWEQKINLNAMSTVVDAETFVTSMVARAKDISQEIQIYTYRPGLQIGQTIQINLKDIGLDSQGSPALGNFFLIDSVKITTDGNRKLFTVTASIDAPIIGSWKAQLKRGLGVSGGVNAHPLAVPLSAIGLASGVGSGSTGGSGTGGATSQTPEANLIHARSWIDETGRQPATNNVNNTETQPFRYNGYLYYAGAADDGTFQVWKSTDNGRTWAALDTTHAPADVSSPSAGGIQGTSVFDGAYTLWNAILIPFRGASISLYKFNLSTEKWGSQITGGPNADQVCSIFYRPQNTTVFVTYDRGKVDPSPTRSRFWGVSYNYSAGTWGTSFDVGAALLTYSASATGDVQSTFSTGVVDPNGRIHFFLNNFAGAYFWYQAVELGDSRGSSNLFAKPTQAGEIPTYNTNSNAVVTLGRVLCIVVTLDAVGSPVYQQYALRVLVSSNLSPRQDVETDWTLGGTQL